jgi:hypothetical protein
MVMNRTNTGFSVIEAQIEETTIDPWWQTAISFSSRTEEKEKLNPPGRQIRRTDVHRILNNRKWMVSRQEHRWK